MTETSEREVRVSFWGRVKKLAKEKAGPVWKKAWPVLKQAAVEWAKSKLAKRR